MKTVWAKDFDIHTNEDITEKLFGLFDYLKTIDEEKTVIFDKGTYFLDSEKCKKYRLSIKIMHKVTKLLINQPTT